MFWAPRGFCGTIAFFAGATVTVTGPKMIFDRTKATVAGSTVIFAGTTVAVAGPTVIFARTTEIVAAAKISVAGAASPLGAPRNGFPACEDVGLATRRGPGERPYPA
jgi:hypothetical protein